MKMFEIKFKKRRFSLAEVPKNKETHYWRSL
jgi:hypothetical protein